MKFAEEGMLIPSLIKDFHSDMKAEGMKLTADQIYSINNSSIKDAIISFNGSCTAEIISYQGLILTNHHCGLYSILSHSSLENDYLKNGFWAKTNAEELVNKDLTATRIVQIDDVTSSVLFGLDEIPLQGHEQKIKENIQIIKEKNINTHYRIDIKKFDNGNSYYAMTTEVFTDVRLVGAPPSSISKFGGDIDNWVWPRHTGDFALFRIYVGVDNKPADYCITNIPYVPKYSLTIDAGHRKPGEFTMVYGFPKLTEQHIVSVQLAYLINHERPARIGMREKSLSIINAGINTSDDIRIKYTTKQIIIANLYKKWIGQVQKLTELNIIELKKEYENRYTETAQKNHQWNTRYGSIVERMNILFEENKEYDFVNTIIMEYIGSGPEFFKQMRAVDELVKNYQYISTDEINNKIENIKVFYTNLFKSYDKEIDQAIFNLLHTEFINLIDKNYITSIISKKTEEWSNEIYTKSIFTDSDNSYTRGKFLEKIQYYKKILELNGINKIKNNGIAICLDRNADYFALIFASWLLGGFYLPISKNSSRVSINYQLRKSGVILFFYFKNNKITFKKIKNKNKQIYKNICYIIFTSGSTGEKKGVCISYKNFNQYLVSIKASLKNNFKSKSLLITGDMSFDIVNADLAFALIYDCEICISEDQINIFGLFALLEKRKTHSI